MPDSLQPNSQSELTEHRSGTPRFRLQHLLVLTAVMAVMLAAGGQQYGYPGTSNLPPLLREVMTGWGILFAILNAVGITIVLYGIYWRRQGLPFFDQPGHWLLLVNSLVAVIAVIQQLAFRMLFDADGLWEKAPPAGSQAPPISMTMIAVLGIVYFLAILVVQIGLNVAIGRKQTQRIWRWVFYLKAAAPFLWLFGQLLFLGFLIRACMADRREHVPRDSAHKLGVALQLATDVLALGMSLSMLVLFWTQFSKM